MIQYTKLNANKYRCVYCNTIGYKDKMENLTCYYETRNGVDIGYHESNLEPLHGKGRIGKGGIDKNFTLTQMIELAREINANIIVKAGPNAKWYLKRCNIDDIDKTIQKQKWRDTRRAVMYIIHWF